MAGRPTLGHIASIPLTPISEIPTARRGGDAVITIDTPTTVRPAATASASARPTVLQVGYQSARKEHLNAAYAARHDTTIGLEVTDENLARFKEMNDSLQAFDVAMRTEKAKQFLGEVFHMLGTDKESVLRELRNEALVMQIPSVLSAVIGLAPTWVGSSSPHVPTGIGSVAFAVAGQVYQPLVGVLLANAFYGAFDMQRSAGMPGRSTQLERSKPLSETATALAKANRELEEALEAAHKVTVGTPEAMAHMHTLLEKQDAVKTALAERTRRDASDHSYITGQYYRSSVGMLKQFALWLTQIAVFVNNDDCHGTKRMYQAQMAMIAILQLAQAIAAPIDRKREGMDIMAANLAHGKIGSEDDVRDMIRMPMTQKMWLVNDGVEKRTLAKLGELAVEFGVSKDEMRKFEEAGGFDQHQYATPLDAAAQARWDQFKTLCDGPPLANCHGALQELEKLVVLEEVTKLKMLEDLDALGVLRTLSDLHDTAGSATDTVATPDLAHIARSLDLPSETQAQALLDGPLPNALQRRLASLQKTYAPAPDGSPADTARVPLWHLRTTLGLGSDDEARALANGPLPPRLDAALAALRQKFTTDAPIDQLRSTLGLASADAARALRQHGLPANAHADLMALQRKYDTRDLLTPDMLVEPTRKDMLEWTDMARAESALLTPLQIAVCSRLEAKARTSTLNMDGWRTYLAGEEDADRTRADKSLTPFEHALLLTLKVQPRENIAETASAGHRVTDHDLHARKLAKAPKSLANVQKLLKQLREIRLDRTTMPWDFTHLTLDTTDSILNVLQGEQSATKNAWDAVKTRWNMAGYIVPVAVAQYGRAASWVVGGSSFVWLMNSVVGLVRKAERDQFACEPGKGPNDASIKFSAAMMAVSGVFMIPALFNAWNAPAAVNTGNIRLNYFRGGKPGALKMFQDNFIPSAGPQAAHFARQHLATGPRLKNNASQLLERADRRLAQLAGPTVEEPDDEPDTVADHGAGSSAARRPSRNDNLTVEEIV